jgi:GT2 family glycosyltransferase
MDDRDEVEDRELQIRELLEIEKMRNLEIANLERELGRIKRRKNKRIKKLDLELWHENRRADDLDRKWNELAMEYERMQGDLERTGQALMAVQQKFSYRVFARAVWIAKGRAFHAVIRKFRSLRKVDSRDPDDGPLIFRQMDDPVVSIIILAWKTAPHLKSCLRALTKSVRSTSYEVVMILNEPADELVQFVEQETVGIRTVTTRVNVGYGGAVNLGVARARGEFIVLLNDDTEVTEQWLEPLVETARRRPNAAAVGSTTLFPDGTVQEAGSLIWADGSTVKVGRNFAADDRSYDFERRVEHCSGTSLLVRRSSWNKIDGMAADAYFPAYYEDTDFCLRLIEAGEEVWYQPRSYISHIESASTNSLYRSFLFEKNQAVFYDRWAKRLKDNIKPHNLDLTEINDGVWRAMDRPVRVLVLADADGELAALCQSLIGDSGCHLALLCPTRIVNNDELCAMGVAVVDWTDDRSLQEHLSSSANVYDIVINCCADRDNELLRTVKRNLPSLPVALFADAYPDTTSVNVEGQLFSSASTPWSEVLRQMMNSRSSIDSEGQRV